MTRHDMMAELRTKNVQDVHEDWEHGACKVHMDALYAKINIDAGQIGGHRNRLVMIEAK